VLSFCTASERGASPAAGACEEDERGARTYVGRSERQRAKSGSGKTVRALTRMLVMVSSRLRCGLNWYLESHGCQHMHVAEAGVRGGADEAFR
jgi:hypothetical protein